jgi:hypothetical protein
MTEPTVCPTNLSRAGKRRRLVMGSVVLAAALAAHFAWRPEPGSWRAIVGVAVLFYGWLCVTQALSNT